MRWRSRVTAAAVAGSPSVAFVVTNTASSLHPALIVAAVVAVAAFAWNVSRKEPLWQAIAGLVVVGACAGTAAITGQARGFFLVPMLVPIVLILACTGTLLIGRPLTGLILNRVVGGPKDWQDNSRLKRIYTVTTLISLAINIANLIVQISLYAANRTVALGAIHVVTGPLNLAVVAVTLVLARRTTHAPAAVVG